VGIKEFITAREELSPIQRETVDWDKGPLLVLAGPGSGKQEFSLAASRAFLIPAGTKISVFLA